MSKHFSSFRGKAAAAGKLGAEPTLAALKRTADELERILIEHDRRVEEGYAHLPTIERLWYRRALRQWRNALPANHRRLAALRAEIARQEKVEMSPYAAEANRVRG